MEYKIIPTKLEAATPLQLARMEYDTALLACHNLAIDDFLTYRDFNTELRRLFGISDMWHTKMQQLKV